MNRLTIQGRIGTGLLALLLLTAAPVYGNYKFYSVVKHVCKVYQIEVEYRDMKIAEDFDNSLILDLHLTAGRNNFDTVLMVGFMAAGKGLDQVPELQLKGVNVYVTINTREQGVIIASAAANDIVRLSRGDISAAEFKTKYLTII